MFVIRLEEFYKSELKKTGLCVGLQALENSVLYKTLRQQTLRIGENGVIAGSPPLRGNLVTS